MNYRNIAVEVFTTEDIVKVEDYFYKHGIIWCTGKRREYFSLPNYIYMDNELLYTNGHSKKHLETKKITIVRVADIFEPQLELDF